MPEAPIPSIVVVGSLNVDSVVQVPRFPAPGETLVGSSHVLYPGGKGANQAYGAGKLSRGNVRVAMLGQVGGDGYGGWLKQNLADIGVDVAGVIIDAAASTGVAAITIDGRGQNHIIVVPGANGTFAAAHVVRFAADLQRARVALLQLEIPLATVERSVAIARDGNGLVVLDPAPAQTVPPHVLAMCDFITPNENELRVLLGDAASDVPLRRPEAIAGARALQTRGARSVIVKMGAAGAVCVTRDEVIDFAPFAVDPVDTTAAGDAWNAAFAVALAEGAPLPAAGRFACASAALSVGRAGAQPSMPARDDVEGLLRASV